MADRFLTISDAEDFTGKSRSTLRRFIDGIVKAEKSPDRHLLRPTPEEVAALRAQNQPFAWQISEELLRRQFLPPESAGVGDRQSGAAGLAEGDQARLVAVLEKSLSILERELSEKNTQIAAMNQRLQESNILMKDLQQRLALPSGRPAEAPVTDAVERDAAASQAAAGEMPKPRKRRFGWFFGA
jgi:hypothetical protein